jgi:hypothetical protein
MWSTNAGMFQVLKCNKIIIKIDKMRKTKKKHSKIKDELIFPVP